MTRRGGRHRPTETGDGEEAEEAGAGDDAGGAPGVPGDELRGGSEETVIGRRLSAVGS
ncbi:MULTISPECIES: hypothetical protein [Streptomyces]|uniref:hypothetical protein n=1 Tax=Streptomyces TaxID=1883 RepID=UPI001F41208F|nr:MULTISPECIES: hypothetical protein [Streptomyces]WJD98903.1 hypothetical protein QR300_24580 [Streptomyces antimycoticus]